MHIQNLKIQNFKNIKDLQIDCKRINIFIGKPNLGKSNLLEALSLYNARFDWHNDLFMRNEIRYKSIPNLFPFNDIKQIINIESELGKMYLKPILNTYLFDFTNYFIA